MSSRCNSFALALALAGCGAGVENRCAPGCALGEVAPPRSMAPPSTARSSTAQPRLQWRLAPGTDGADLDLCRDRACRQLIARVEAAGEEATLDAPLPPGVIFWRAFGRAGSLHGRTPGPTWELFVPARSAPRAGAWGSVPDFDGDGVADLVVAGQYVDQNTGRLYWYAGARGGISPDASQTRTGPDGRNGEFGCTVSSAGDVDGDGFADLLVGAPWAQASAGRVYLYRGGPLGPSPTPLEVATPPGASRFGAKVSWAGDVDGDGYGDVIIGEPGVAFEAPGRAWVYFGGPAGLRDQPFAIPPAPGAAQTGAGVAGLGDLDGDGFADVGVVAFGRDGAFAQLWRGGPGGLDGPRAVPLPGGGVLFGASLQAAGDVDGDGYGDLVTGGYDTTRGSAQLWRGGPGGLQSSPSLTLASGATGDRYGVEVAAALDVDHDGYDDVLVGTNEDAVGHAYLYRGGPGGLDATPMRVLERTERSFGMTLAGAGDLDGDGIDDLVVGAMDDVSAFVWTGAPGGPSVEPRFILRGPDLGGFGGAVQ